MPTQRRLVVGAVLLNERSRPTTVLAARRIGSMAGYWEFPGGKVEPGETPREALARELREELSVDIEIFDQVRPVDGERWPISDGFELELWTAVVSAGELTVGVAHDEIVWVGASTISSLRWLPADVAVVSVLKQTVFAPSGSHQQLHEH